VEATFAPTGTDATLLGVTFAGESAFAVGARGTIVRWDGRAWHEEESGTEENLYAVASAADEVVAVGGNLHIGGNSLVVHRERGVWVGEPSGIQHILLAVTHGGLGWFAAGYNGAILRGRPGAWSHLDVVHYSHVFALAARGAHVFAVGLTGTVVEFDGTAWRQHDSGTNAHLRGLDVFGARDLVAVGLSGVILRYDGRTWAAMDSGTESHLEDVWVAGEAEAYAVGYAGTMLRYDGARWTRLDLDVAANLHAVYGNAREVIAVGGGGIAVHLPRARA
jgi:hypothetical protein